LACVGAASRPFFAFAWPVVLSIQGLFDLDLGECRIAQEFWQLGEEGPFGPSDSRQNWGQTESMVPAHF